MADKVPSISSRRAQAGLPVKATTKELSKMGQITILSAEPGEAKNPQTGEMGPGMLVIAEDSEGRKFRVFMGGVALVRDLQDAIDNNLFPFTTHLQGGEGPGKPWQFVD